MKFRDFLLEEEKSDTAVMTFGRFQPITSAHETLIKQVGSLAKEKGAHPFVFTSRKSGDKKNPLDFNMKSDMLRKHYGVNVPDSEEITNPFQAAKHLGDAGYKNVHLVLGGDRVKDIGGMIKKYMGHEDPEKRINISNLTLHSAGERSANPVSGTAVRAAARSGNVKEFQRMIAPSLGKESTETIYRVLRGEQQLGESLDKPYPTTYKTRTISGRKRHYYNFVMPPIDPNSRIDNLSQPKKGVIEFSPTVDSSGRPTKKGQTELSFTIDGDTHTTGGGRAGGAFSTVKSAVKDYMKNNPDTKVLKASILDGDQFKKDSDGNVVKDKDGKPVFSGRAKLYKRLANYFGNEYGFDVEVDMKRGLFRGTRKIDESLDKPFPIKHKIKDMDGDLFHQYVFKIPAPEGSNEPDRKGKVSFEPLGSGDEKYKHIDMSFTVDDSTELSGKGSAGRIMSTILSAGDQFVADNPDVESISAETPPGESHKKTDTGKKVLSGRSKSYSRLFNFMGKKHGFDVESDMDRGVFTATRKGSKPIKRSQTMSVGFKPSSAFAEEVNKNPSKRTGHGSVKFVGFTDYKTGKHKIQGVFAHEPLPDHIQISLGLKPKPKPTNEEANPRIPREEGQPAKSKKHSDLYTDEDPKGTIHGLGFTNASRARESVKKIKNSGRKHAHKIQAAIAMSQRAKVASQRAKDPKKKKSLAAAHKVYQSFIDRNKKSD